MTKTTQTPIPSWPRMWQLSSPQPLVVPPQPARLHHHHPDHYEMATQTRTVAEVVSSIRQQMATQTRSSSILRQLLMMGPTMTRAVGHFDHLDRRYQEEDCDTDEDPSGDVNDWGRYHTGSPQ